jgi:hypothetical protein
MYFRGILIDNTQFFIDEKKGEACFGSISVETNDPPLLYQPEKEGERRFPAPGEGPPGRGAQGNY